MKYRIPLVFAVTMLAGMVTQAAVPEGVSPGAVERVATIRSECPTFSWQSVEGTAFYELVAYRLPEDRAPSVDHAIDLSDADEVLYTRVPGGATSWTPELEQCLAAGGSYVWFVRAVFDEVDGLVLDAGEWSEGRFFAVTAAPSVEEVEQALQVLRLYLGEDTSGGAPLEERFGTENDNHEEIWQQTSSLPESPDRSVLTATAAIRGSMPDDSGELYGVVGVSNSADGAGLAAANTAAGADLVLDGSSHGTVDTVLTESGLDRRSSTTQSFNFTNSGAGVMRLKENGVRVVTTATDQDTLGDLQCANGKVAKWNGSAWVCANDKDTDTLGDLQCANGKVAKWNGSAWVCANDQNTGMTLPFQATHATAGATFRINNSSTSGNVFALRGENASTAGAAVYGWSTRSTGVTSGVVGQSSSTAGTGVFGLADSGTGDTYGVAGISTSSEGAGVAGFASASSGYGAGVYGTTGARYGYGVLGYNSATTNRAYGVLGESDSNAGYGVYGHGSALSGTTYGVYGRVESPDGIGVYGYAGDWEGANIGVKGASRSMNGIGVYGVALEPSGTNYGVYGFSNSHTGYGGYFDGDVWVVGTLIKSSGSFKIDHPLDPENRYLQHSFVESPDMMNVYNGNVILNERGEAWVEMPDWFEVLNRDFRYQLTCIGGHAPVYIAEKVHDRRFLVAGGEPGLEVSWQLTGIRQDPWAEAHPIQVEVDKPEDERGTYLAPELYGQPEELGVSYELTHDLEAASEH